MLSDDYISMLDAVMLVIVFVEGAAVDADGNLDTGEFWMNSHCEICWGVRKNVEVKFILILQAREGLK